MRRKLIIDVSSIILPSAGWLALFIATLTMLFASERQKE